MKQITSNNRIIAIALITVFSLATVPAALANGSKEVPAELSYVGHINNHQLFQLSVAGTELNDEFLILIKDDYGNMVYKENIKSVSFSKRFLFDAEELSIYPLHFEVYSKKTKKSVVYAINSSISQVENVVVKELK